VKQGGAEMISYKYLLKGSEFVLQWHENKWNIYRHALILLPANRQQAFYVRI
jgi:hypothetical protein